MLEQQTLESPKHYKNIEELQHFITDTDSELQKATLAAVALCRVFCHLIASEKLAKDKNASEKEVQIVQWLKGQLREYATRLCGWIGSPDATRESTSLTLLMRVVKEDASGGNRSSEQSWRNPHGTFTTLVQALLQANGAEGARQEFVEKFVEEHDDVRFHTFVAVKQVLQQNHNGTWAENAIDLLSQIEGVPEAEDQLEDWYGAAPDGKSPLRSLSAHRKAAREAWLAIFRSPLSAEQLKKLVAITTAQILPWFANHVELLSDFLTDSFNQGGAMSLLALSGIFYLMTEKNLDYPDFYTKLYSLLDEDVLHSKHRSRFFRLLEKCMSSTHLPAAMIASFIKRLSRLALQAPPGAIVWIVPWVYNQLKQHPPCTFMLHRPFHPAHAIYSSNPAYEQQGMDDTFDMKHTDPNTTGAIDSSLWELETLRGHYHPNVATLAKIVGEQFTKRDYQLEDFLDHSYGSLIDAELGKEMKKAPVVEWEIPKRIVTAEDGGLNSTGTLLLSALAVS
jgi:U3 small nucleolar RNA-associated protein 19